MGRLVTGQYSRDVGILFSQREGLQPASVLRRECREWDRTLVDGWYSVLRRRWGLAPKKEFPPLRYCIGRKGAGYSEPMDVARARLIPDGSLSSRCPPWPGSRTPHWS